jgi:diguanylate cyclase (GGDEF)-like protein
LLLASAHSHDATPAAASALDTGAVTGMATGAATGARSGPAASDAPVGPAGPRTELQHVVEQALAALRTEPETLLRLTDRALALLVTSPDPDLEAQVRVLRCEYYNERDRAAAEREIARVHELAAQLRQPGHRAGILGCEGELYEQTGDNTRAMALYEQAVAVAEAARDERRLAEVLFLRGYLRGVLGDFAQGLADLRRSLALFEKLGLPDGMRTTVNAVAGLYTRMGDLDQARHYYDGALRSMPAGTPSRERVVAQHNLARNLERAGQWDEAQRHYEQVLANSRELQYRRGQVHALRGLAAVRNARGDAARALQFVDEAQRLGAQVPDVPLRARLLVQRAAALRQLGRPADGVPALREAIRLFASGDAIPEEGAAREELARSAADLGDWRLAYGEQVRAMQISQDLLRRQVDHRFATMKAQFDADARERELVMLQREKDAGERALAEQQRAARLQIVAALLAALLALLLALLAWRKHRAGQAMHLLAMTDELTGLPNRRSALAAAEAVIVGGQRAKMLILDIDHFKRINDQHGHAAGDAVLQAVARAWRGVVAPAAAAPLVTLGRLGGEEFLAVLPGADLDAARALAERLREAASAPDLSRWLGPGRLTVSVGITPLGAGDTLAGALARADQALYRAKDAGRDRVEVVD